MIKLLRKNIGTIIAAFGLIILCILTFGDIGEILTAAYWINVKDNLTSIGFLSVSLVMVQVTIKQGISEQSLQKGLNTETTTKKYKEHKEIVNRNSNKMIYMPYFLQGYNKRHTELRKRDFLIDNNFESEKMLYESKNKKLIQKYRKIRIYITTSRIKWATTDIVYNKYGQILTLSEYRAKRTMRAICTSFLFMIGTTLLARGLFYEETTTPITEKFVKLLTYIVIIFITSALPIIKEYEKGAFGVPNELDEINEIWKEFENWKIPQWAIDKVEKLNKKEIIDERTERNDSGADLSTEQKESKMAKKIDTRDILDTNGNNNTVLLLGSPK